MLDRPVVSRAAVRTYVARRNRRLERVPLLVDIWWHGPGAPCMGRYCVCRVSSISERLEEYDREAAEAG